MGKVRSMPLGFPLAGLDRKVAYRQRRPFATNDCLNVRPTATIENRDRGGSRPGLEKFRDGVNLGSEIRLLSSVTLPMLQDFTVINESFPNELLSGETGTAISSTSSGSGDWIKYTDIDEWVIALPIYYSGNLAGNYSHDDTREVWAIHPLSTVNVEKPYTIRVHIVPKDGVIETPFLIQIGARIDPGTILGPWGNNVVVDAEIIDDAVILYWESYINGDLEDGGSQFFAISPARIFSEDLWFEATFLGNTIVSVSLFEYASSLSWTVTPNMEHSNHSGMHVGFGIWGYYDINENIRISGYNIQYHTTKTIGIGVGDGEGGGGEEDEAGKTGSPPQRTLLVASSNGNIFMEWQE